MDDLSFQLGNRAVGKSDIRDRQVYVTATGQLRFALSADGSKTITSPKAYNDGKWHQVAASLSSGSGMVLHVDGAKVASNAAVTTAVTLYEAARQRGAPAGS